VDSLVGGKMSTIKSNSTIMEEIHTKIDNRSAKFVHYNEKFHYYGVHYYEINLFLSDQIFFFTNLLYLTLNLCGFQKYSDKFKISP
jgi:hypothetical protein